MRRQDPGSGNEVLYVRVPAGVKQDLQRIADARAVSLSWLVSHVLGAWVTRYQESLGQISPDAAGGLSIPGSPGSDGREAAVAGREGELFYACGCPALENRGPIPDGMRVVLPARQVDTGGR